MTDKQSVWLAWFIVTAGMLTATAQVAGSIRIQTPAKYKISKPFSSEELLGTIKKALK